MPGVVALLAGGLLYEAWALLPANRARQLTISQGVWKLSSNPYTRTVLVSAWAGLSYHLFFDR